MADHADNDAPKSHAVNTEADTLDDGASPLSPSCLPRHLTTADIPQILLENQKLIQAINQNQNLGKLADCYLYLEALQRNIMYLGRFADLPGYVGEDHETWPPSIQQRWARDEFDRLRIAVHTYGAANIEQLTQFVATKSQEEVVKMLPLFAPNLPPQAAVQSLQQPIYKATGFGWQTTHVPGPSQLHMTSYDPNTVAHPAGLASLPTAAGSSTAPSSHPAAALPTTTHHARPPHNTGGSRQAALPVRASHQNALPLAANSSYGHAPTSYDNEGSSGTANFSTSMFQSDNSFRQMPPNQPSMPGAHPINTSRSSSNNLPRADTPIPGGHNGTTEFINYQAYAAPHSSSGHTMSSQQSSFMMNTSTANDTPAYQSMASQNHSQPTISISVYESEPLPMNSSSSRSMYVPAPGQAFVNMDRTTLFTPSNPPRPGSPRSPRTPKTPKSPKTPITSAPHTPK